MDSNIASLRLFLLVLFFPCLQLVFLKGLQYNALCTLVRNFDQSRSILFHRLKLLRELVCNHKERTRATKIISDSRSTKHASALRMLVLRDEENDHGIIVYFEPDGCKIHTLKKWRPGLVPLLDVWERYYNNYEPSLPLQNHPSQIAAAAATGRHRSPSHDHVLSVLQWICRKSWYNHDQHHWVV